jgi:hypothetical protein
VRPRPTGRPSDRLPFVLNLSRRARCITFHIYNETLKNNAHDRCIVISIRRVHSLTLCSLHQIGFPRTPRSALAAKHFIFTNTERDPNQQLMIFLFLFSQCVWFYSLVMVPLALLVTSEAEDVSGLSTNQVVTDTLNFGPLSTTHKLRKVSIILSPLSLTFKVWPPKCLYSDFYRFSIYFIKFLT